MLLKSFTSTKATTTPVFPNIKMAETAHENEKKVDQNLNNDAAPSPSDSDVELDTSGINEKALLRKLDIKLLPGLVILYLLSFLDRSNGGFLPE